jgi:creatinine amidohydrolase
MMMATEPNLVRVDVMRSLKSTDLGPEDLAEWRKGHEHAKRKTPLGYFGDPASADAELGMRIQEVESVAMAEAIIRRVNVKP